jgi:serine/threonine-protein kinase
VDFGIAKAMSGEEGQNVTRTGLVVGTPEYMSPEQLSGDNLDGRSDVYSLSLVFFRMITGTLPFQAESAQEVMIKRLTDDPARLTDAFPGGVFPPKLQSVLDHAMERMPSDRYATADDFAADAIVAIHDIPAQSPAPAVDTQGETQLMDTGSSDPAVTEELKKTRLSEPQVTVAMSDSDHDATAEPEVVTAATAVSQAPEAPHTPETPMPQTTPEAPKKKPYVAIAASAVVIGIVGSVGYVTLTGGGNGELNVGPDSTMAGLLPGDSDSTDNGIEDDSAANDDQSGSTPGQDSNQSDPGQSDPGDSDTITPPESAESLEDISAELVTLGRQASIESSGQERASARNRSVVIYEMRDMPDSVRARAAQIVAESYEEQSMDDACTWIDRAITLQPDNENYSNYKEFILGCPT